MIRPSPRHVLLLGTAAVLVGLYGVGCVGFRNFASLGVAVNLVGDNAFLGIAAIGMTAVIISGGIDLSVGAVVAATSTLVASLVAHGHHPLVAMGTAVAAGLTFGLAQGGLIVAYRLPPFLVTLAGMFFARGIAFCIEPQSLAIAHPFVAQTLNRAAAVPLTARVDLPATAMAFLLLLGLAVLVANWTAFGRTVYAVGDDEPSARLMGLPVRRTKLLVDALSGACAGVAGVVYACYTQSGDPASCVGFELDAIAAVVIGGTLLRGGSGSVLGTAMGVLILGLIQTLITFKGDVNSWWTRIVVGGLVLAFILLQDAAAALARRLAAEAR